MKQFKYIALLVLGITVLGSCKKYEKLPAEAITEDYVYDTLDVNGIYAQLVVNNIYSHLNRGFNRIDGVVLDAASDDAIPSELGNDIEVLSKGRLTATNNVDDNWAAGYNCIRKVNHFLSRQSRVPRDPLTKQFWRAEVRFIRAFTYFEMIKRYGGVPLIMDKVIGLDEKIDYKRNTFNECVDYIVKECDLIKDSLRKETSTVEFPTTEWGKVTRSAALALKSRVLLYAASALNNPTNDIAKWQAAAAAAKDLMNLNYHSLNASFVGTFVTRSNREIILAYQRSLTNDLETFNAPVGFGAPNISYGFVSPTQELVDSFPMRTGASIFSSGSGYDPLNPYLNRDPRFYFTVFHNGSKWLNRDVETFEGGKDKPGGLLTQTRTGYYMRKFLADFSTSTAFSSQTHNFPIFRYAEILLNYAEAMNEAGNQTEAYTQLRALRARAGITAGTGNTFGIPNGLSQVQMREFIRAERRIELAFEEHRFWDIRRWKIAEQVMNKDVMAMKITKTSATTFTYERVKADRVSFSASRMYYYPIPFNEVLANPGLVQNTGY